MLNDNGICHTCGKSKWTYSCKGCTHEYCQICLPEHMKLIDQQFDQLQADFEQFHNRFKQQKEESMKYELIQQIEQWQQDAIEKIKKMAEKCKTNLINHTNDNISLIETQANHLADKIKTVRQDIGTNEIDLNNFQNTLQRLKQDLNQLSTITLHHESTSFIHKISIPTLPNIAENAKWSTNGVVIAGGHGKGDGLHQLNCPTGIYVDDNLTVYVADKENHRIVAWKQNATIGEVVAGGNGKGNELNQLSDPWDLILDKETNSLIISDTDNNRVLQWPLENNMNAKVLVENIRCVGLAIDDERHIYVVNYDDHEVRKYRIGESIGTVVAGGNGQGDHLNQLSHPKYFFIDRNENVYVSDELNHRVMKWTKGAKEGTIIAGGRGKGSGPNQFMNPLGVLVDQFGRVYVADYWNGRVIRCDVGATLGNIIIGETFDGQQENQLSRPLGLSFDRYGNLYVTDYHNHQVKRFSIQ